MLGFAHDHETLRNGAENPFSDVRVRRAVARAVNVPAILQTIMRGSAEPAAQLVAAGTSGYSPDHDARPTHDPEAARALLAEAGYPDGFAFDFSCTNDRYLNDEAVCQAIVAMLAQVGLDATLDAMPVSTYWPELRAENFDMYLVGWSPGTFDAEHPIRFLVHTAGERLGTWNFGGYSSARIDELLPVMQSEIDPDLRQAAMDEAAGIIQEDMVYVPLYVQPLLWGVRDGISVTQRPDNFFILRWMSME
jgi:peptide/nickel transport system substrate-binding protein